jgi:hypothetical protein
VLERAVDAAVADLAGRLGIAAEDVRVIEVATVVWPDAGLGCPHPGMRYAQVPQDGARILLDAGGRTYRYHLGGRRTDPFLCEDRPDRRR